MESVPLQAIYQCSVQSVIISCIENCWVVIGLERLHLIFTHTAHCPLCFDDSSFPREPLCEVRTQKNDGPVVLEDLKNFNEGYSGAAVGRDKRYSCRCRSNGEGVHEDRGIYLPPQNRPSSHLQSRSPLIGLRRS